MLRLAPILALVLACGCALERCRSERPEEEEVLLARVAVADKSWEGVLVEFGAPRALPLLDERVWSHGEEAPDGSTFRWAVSETAGFRFESPREGRHLAFFEVEPFRFPGSPPPWMGLSVNGIELPRIELRPGRGRYPVELPLARGDNRVELRFSYAGAPRGTGPEGRRLAAAFYRFEVPFGEGSPRAGPFVWVEPEGGDPALLLPSGGRLSFFLTLPSRARLSIQLGSSDPRHRAPPEAEVTATLRSDRAELFREAFRASAGEGLWERELSGIPEAPVSLTLEGSGGDLLVRPELFVERGEPEPPEPRVLSRRPDIVVVVLDGANALRMGLYGSGETTTPRLDELGRESVVFDLAVSQAVYTIASIGSLLTGQYPDRHQSVSFADRLRQDVATLPAILSEAGYRTAAFAGNAVVSKTFGLDRGYREFFAVWEDEEYTGRGDSVLRAFRAWHERREEEPFFAYVHFREPHFPYDPPPPFDRRFGPGHPFPEGIRDAEIVERLNRRAAGHDLPSVETLSRIRALYHGNLAYVDSLVGELASELDPDTILIVTSDHGEALFEHGFLGHNTQLYEESIRIPLLLRVPGFAPRRVPGLVELIDLTPTVLELAGLGRHPAAAGMQGTSLVPALSPGAAPQKRLAFSRTLWNKPRYAIRTPRYKLIWDSRTGASELYDLHSDPGEESERVDEIHQEGYLRQELFLWYREQERLRSKEPPPGDAILSEDQRRMLEALDYTEHLPPREPDETKP